MKQKWLARLDAIESCANSPQLEELLDKWISKNYPNDSITSLEYLNLPSIVPKELKEVIGKRLREILNSVMDISRDLIKRGD